ncbi:aldehyde dehydrogenase family protein [Roseomonas sp. NAR14]|uniref:Aldehyde dehydrogenase family protein n=1 Tax=Roseomonas acroporae TaxID=2937791 RepID=A0A9X1Y6J9_9PROT|nr:aldehyde dehydrogenase family protein [Roseomonas acroporae]MCK8784503.1 aldehyde dehydrogenase family protein [Roseomonas acroporae]
MVIGSFIGGEAATPGAPAFDLVQPGDGHVIGTMLEAGAEGVEAAVAAARAAFLAQRRAPLHQRLAWLRAAARALEGAAEEIAGLISADIGKPIRAARFEARRGVEFLEATAAAASQLGGEVLPLDAAANGAGTIGMTRRVPYGVVGAITPFNAPINLLVQKLAPAIAAGNSVVVKPAPGGLRAALRLAALCVEAGWPAGLFNVVSGDRETAAALAAHPDVRAVTFTGGTAAGDALARVAGAKKFLAELGSNAANLVFADTDLATAARKIAAAGFEASGQQCISAQRVLVQRSALDDFLPAFATAARALRVGPAEDPATDVGPMVHLAAAERVMAMVEDAIALGARAVLVPERRDALVSPGILLDVADTARLWREEVFGPVVLVRPFDTIEEAIALANDTPFGLQAAAFTGSLATALRLADEIEVGSLWINEASRFRLDMYPFGGVKSSGVGREGVRYAIEELSQVKFIGMRP